MHSSAILALLIALAASTLALPAPSPIAQEGSSPTTTYSDPWATETPTVPPSWCGLGPGLGHGLVPRQDEAAPTTTAAADGGSAASSTPADPFASITYAGSPECSVVPGNGWRA